MSGKRKCPTCGERVDADEFSRHLWNHAAAEAALASLSKEADHK